MLGESIKMEIGRFCKTVESHFASLGAPALESHLNYYDSRRLKKEGIHLVEICHFFNIVVFVRD